MDIERKQLLGILFIALVLFGLLVLPLLLKMIYGFNPVNVAFAVIIFYIAVNFILKRSNYFED